MVLDHEQPSLQLKLMSMLWKAEAKFLKAEGITTEVQQSA